MSRRPTPDRFDEPSVAIARRGAHRVSNTRRGAWATLGWIALLALVAFLVVLGALIVGSGLLTPKGDATSASSSSASPKASSASPVATVSPTVDPKSAVDVLNGTDTAGLAGTMATKLANAGWTIGTKGNAENISATKVYYSNAALKGAALGVVQSLGFGTAEQSDLFANAASPITVVLGADAR